MGPYHVKQRKQFRQQRKTKRNVEVSKAFQLCYLELALICGLTISLETIVVIGNYGTLCTPTYDTGPRGTHRRDGTDENYYLIYFKHDQAHSFVSDGNRYSKPSYNIQYITTCREREGIQVRKKV